jgi:hypothetical protein
VPIGRLQRSALLAGGALLLVAAVEAQSCQGLSSTNLQRLMLRFQASDPTGGTGGNGAVITGGNPRDLSWVGTVLNPGDAPPP